MLKIPIVQALEVFPRVAFSSSWYIIYYIYTPYGRYTHTTQLCCLTENIISHSPFVIINRVARYVRTFALLRESPAASQTRESKYSILMNFGGANSVENKK